MESHAECTELLFYDFCFSVGGGAEVLTRKRYNGSDVSTTSSVLPENYTVEQVFKRLETDDSTVRTS